MVYGRCEVEQPFYVEEKRVGLTFMVRGEQVAKAEYGGFCNFKSVFFGDVVTK
jgi:hypothetical protein